MTTPTLDVETLDELRHYVQLGRDDFRAEMAHGTYSDDDLAEAERRWQKVRTLLAVLDVDARSFPTNASGYVLCFRIVRGGVHAGPVDEHQYPTQEAAETALGETYTEAMQRRKFLRVARTLYLTPSGRPLRKEPGIP